MKIHDEDAERAAEIAKEAAAGGDIGSLVASPPVVVKEWKYLVIDLYKAEGLPVMDGKVGALGVTAKKAGTDAFMKLTFAGGKPLKTPVVTKKGESPKMINPSFNIQLWYPVSIPTMTQVIKLSMWDKDDTADELIANISAKFGAIKKADRQTIPPRWYNMYGCHEFKQGKLLDNLAKGADLIKKSAKQTLGTDIDWADYYNNSPDKATAFKGRVLMQMRIVDKPPKSGDSKKKKDESPEKKPFRLKMKNGLKSNEEPKVSNYTLQALVISGSDLPKLGLGSTLTGGEPFRVKLAIGVDEVSTKSAKNEKGVCRWNEFIALPNLDYPEDVNQIPDIFVYLCKDNGKPICYARVKPFNTDKGQNKATVEDLIGFDTIIDWVLLREDKLIDALSESVFPGQILMKLGFGPTSEVEKWKNDWDTILSNAKRFRPFQLRVHLYQARNLPASDSNGLSDPYMYVGFAGEEKKSSHRYKTLFPTYYETKIFDEISIPFYENFALAPQVSIRLYDKDNLDSDDYLGFCNFHLRDAQFSEDPNEPLVDPIWKKFFYEVPGDSSGEVLMSVQLIPLADGRKLHVKEEDIDITPPTRMAFVEFIVIGVRDMAPFHFQEMQNPFLEINLNSFGTEYKSATGASKRPTPSNPNYLEKIVMEVKLPENSIYCTPLSVIAKDTRLGGYMKPIVGVCQIDLSTKLPWDEKTYIAPRTDLFKKSNVDMSQAAGNGDTGGGMIPLENQDPTAMKAKQLENERLGAARDDDYIALNEPAQLQSYIQERVALEDTGAGIFGALNHINTDGSTKRKKKTGEDAFEDPDLVPDEGEQPPAWAINRTKLPSELEEELKTTPFESYSLMRGQVNGFVGSTLKVVGRLKGLVRVIMDKNAPPLLDEKLMDDLLKPSSYSIRLYILRGIRLAAMDNDIWGKPTSSDPYLKVSLGKNMFDDRKHAIEGAIDVDFYKYLTFDTELPGISQLRINVMDKDMIGSDDLIGTTVIDLEDRWFDSRWQDWGNEFKLLPGQDTNDPTHVRFAPKPVERRSLYVPGINELRGTIECWVDIMTNAEASTFPPDDVSLPPTQMFEVRVVIWKSKNVPPMDTFEGMSDLFVKCWPEGCDPQETDTHWRCKKGKASWNWRLLFDVELGHNTRAMKFPFLHIQLWDRDLLKWSDCAGETMVDLGSAYRKAFKKCIAIKLYEKKKGLAAKRHAKRQAKARVDLDAILDAVDDLPPEEEEEGEEGTTPGEDNQAISTDADDTGINQNPMNSNNVHGYATSPTLLGANSTNAKVGGTDDRDSDDDDDAYHDTGMGAIPSRLPSKTSSKKKKDMKMLLRKPAKSAALKKAEEESKAKAAAAAATAAGQPSIWTRLMFWKKASGGEGGVDDDKKPLLNGGDDEEKKDEEIGEKTEEQKKDDENDEIKELVTTFKNMTGLWDIDPEDSAWVNFEQRDKNDPTKVIPMGSVAYR
jgi:hypothetical protein